MFDENDLPDFAVAGDWHGNMKYARTALTYLNKKGKDLVLHLGDFGTLSPDPDAFLERMNDLAREKNIVVAFIDGNHEHFPWLYSHDVDEDGVRRLASHVWHLPRGFRWNWMGVSFLALGGAYSIDQRMRTLGVSRFSEETLSIEDMHHAVQGGEVDVMLTHDAPDQVTIPSVKDGFFPYADTRYSQGHRHALGMVVDRVKPLHLFHGHFHVKYDTIRESLLTKTYVHGLGADKGKLSDNLLVDVTVEDLRM